MKKLFVILFSIILSSNVYATVNETIVSSELCDEELTVLNSNEGFTICNKDYYFLSKEIVNNKIVVIQEKENLDNYVVFVVPSRHYNLYVLIKNSGAIIKQD